MSIDRVVIQASRSLLGELMLLFLVALAIIVGGGLIATATAEHPRLASLIGASSAVAGATLGLVIAVQVLLGQPVPAVVIPWQLPYGSPRFGMDPLSAFFLVPILAVTAASAVYGVGYLDHERSPRHGKSWFFFNGLLASMALVVVAQSGVAFLIAWELMALSSYFLVVHDGVTPAGENPAVREAGIVYLAAAHLGAAFLIPLFLLLGVSAGSLDFAAIAAHGPPAHAGLLFVLALIGFGSKAGFFPLHVWLPEAHPVAPSHVSAVMSGVMIKTGIYGILRVLTLLGPPPGWWGGLLLGVGIASGVLGVVYALAQHDLKRLLAYSTVENIGIIAIGLGVGLLGQAHGLPAVATLGYAGALLHVVNHALFKGLLFLAAGAVHHGAGTLHLEHLGGLARRMPWTSGLFLLGAVAISGLPPLNGFVGELSVYLGAIGTLNQGPTAGLTAAVTVPALALIGGLAVACFTKAYGVVFLGTPRTAGAAHAHPASPTMKAGMITLAAACVVVAASAWSGLSALAGPLAVLSAPDTKGALVTASDDLYTVVLVAAALALLAGALWALRWRLLRDRVVASGPTWDCGYAAPTTRMQYTGSSYAAPTLGLFDGVLRTKVTATLPDGHLPGAGTFVTRTHDGAHTLIYHPFYRALLWISAHLRPLQSGHVRWYVMYIAVAVAAALSAALRTTP